MDIARTPSTPDGNPEMADAAQAPAVPTLIRREDYRPYPWIVPTTRLDFTLGLNATRIVATLDVQRNPAADASPTLRLNGDGLVALEVTVDGQATSGWVMDGDDIVLTLPGTARKMTVLGTADSAEPRYRPGEQSGLVWALPSEVRDPDGYTLMFTHDD